ncbi:hypothetical protein PFHG_00928 [Plasmodium falciparum HB3]|uniref:Structural maintenance of chromosomes protein 4 n=1 Tax=Plasmodium falciparum (isolate HB3) TaxID=137071 RepID=A0A0L7K8H8_PLAFX|nr:hypothetical protein PFHG_00928 [Plasmodium falciparum HB3]
MTDDMNVNEKITINEEKNGENRNMLSIINNDKIDDKENNIHNDESGKNNILCLKDVKVNRKRIIIEKLVLENFKSYSGVKVIGPFYKKFSCIVGPNGSGKSNIIDAMLFVFGRRAKKIRQNKLSDLIHNSKFSVKNNFTKVSIHFKTITDEEEPIVEEEFYYDEYDDEDDYDEEDYDGDNHNEEEDYDDDGDDNDDDDDEDDGDDDHNNNNFDVKKSEKGNNKDEEEETYFSGREEDEKLHKRCNNIEKTNNIANNTLNKKKKKKRKRKKRKRKRFLFRNTENPLYQNYYHDGDDIEDFVISREATIDNQSKYRINEKVVTQKDVSDLLYKKGIDLNNNRFLILQGEVEQIAQMNPKGNKNEDGLLEYLEEIIGTNKYIESINEHLEKLERCEEIHHEKVHRLKHVYNELKELAGPKKEAKYYMTLQKYTYKLHIIINKKDQYELSKMISDKEKELELFLHKRNNHHMEYKQLLETRKEMNISLSNLEKEEEEVMKKKNLKNNEFKKLNIEDENIKKELLIIVQKMQNLYVKREELKEKDIPSFKRIIEEKQKIINKIKKEELHLLEMELEKCEEELENYNEEIKQDIDKMNTIYSNEEKKLAPLQNSYDNIIKNISEYSNQCHIIEKKKKEYLTHIENLKYLQTKIINELKEKDVHTKYLTKTEEEKRKNLKNKQNDLDEIQSKIQKLNTNLIEETIKYENIKKEVVTDRNMNKLHQFIYNLKKSKIKGIHGMLIDLGYIEKKYEKAFTIASNNCSDFVVVENPNDAVLLFEEVRKANIGRVNVLSLSVLNKNLMTIMLKNEEIYTQLLPNVYRLIDLIKFKNDKYKICFYYIIKETLLANSLEQAHVIAYSHKKRVVTINGELIENDGRICGGGMDNKNVKGNSGNSERGINSSRTSTNNKNNNNNNHNHNSNSSSSIKTSEYDESHLLNSEKIIKELNKNIQDKKKQKDILINDIKDINTFLEDNECKIVIAKKKIDNLKKQLEDIDDQLQNSKTPELTKEEENELNTLKNLIEEKNNEKSKVEIVLKAQENKVKKYYEQLQDVGGEKKKKLKNKFINAERQLNIMKDQLQEHTNEEANALASLEKSEKDIKMFSENILEYEANEKELENELKIIENKGCAVYEEVETLTNLLNDIQSNIEEKQKKKQQVDENISKKDLENVDLVYKIEHLQKELNQYKNKNENYQNKIDEYMDLIKQSDKVIHENMLSEMRCRRLLGKKKKINKDQEDQSTREDIKMDDEHDGKDRQLDGGDGEDGEDGKDDEVDEDEEDDEDEDDDLGEEEEEEEEEEEVEEEVEEDMQEDMQDVQDVQDVQEDVQEEAMREKNIYGHEPYEDIKGNDPNDQYDKLENQIVLPNGRDNHVNVTRNNHIGQDKSTLYHLHMDKNKKRKLNENDTTTKCPEKKKVKKKKKLFDDLKDLEELFGDSDELKELEHEYDHININDTDLDLLNKKDIETKLENKLSILEKKTPNLKIFQDYNLKLYDYKVRRKDVKKSKKEKDKIKAAYDSLCNKRKEEFVVAFNVISSKLKEMYQMIAIGGDAELEIIDSSEIFNEGILFSVRPPKKSWKHIQNLSGGEKTLSSLALVFALHYFKPNPIYFMDEIDAALDFKNVSIISHYIQTKTRNAQFIVISLRNQMFELCDRMIGIYKTNDITKCITLNPHQCTMLNIPNIKLKRKTKLEKNIKYENTDENEQHLAITNEV